MEQRVLGALHPQRVMYYFEELCRIPHGSRNTKAISDYCVGFARSHGLRWVQDGVNNVVIYKDGSAGYEDHPPVILQGHLDMVTEKTADSPIDFTKDPLDIRTDGEFVWAEGTTLGGDDGIAVAYALAILESDRIAHPPLEAVFTVDEEIGMDGAEALDVSVLQGRTLINIDSEDEGILTVSCAGGATCRLHLPVEVQPAQGSGLHIFVDGLIGGHSGQEINRGRANANKVMGTLLERLLKRMPYRLVYARGGQKDNAIPRSSMAKIIVPEQRVEEARRELEKLADELKRELPQTETAAEFATEVCPCRGSAMSFGSTRKTVGLLCAVPNGVQAMSSDIAGLVQTSLNLGVLQTDKDGVTMTFSVRSSVGEEKQALIGRLKTCGADFGADYSESGQYPAWEYRKQSRLRDVMVQTFAELYGREPVVEAIHAGLECGIFSGKIPGLDCVSFGPDMQDIHTTREKLNVGSVNRTWEYLLAILKKL